MTYRGHTAPITSILTVTPNPNSSSPSTSQIVSASLDSTIRIWALPSTTQSLYAAYDPTTTLQTLEGHSEAVWDLVITNNGKLVSASSDGCIKIWTCSENGEWKLGSLKFEEGGIPVCLGKAENDGRIGGLG
jgi:striatin 1/3/4